MQRCLEGSQPLGAGQEASGMMEATRSADLERGMDLLARLPEVMPDEAVPYVRLIYEDIRNTLRVPFVNTIFRVLANYPTYLSFAWSQLGPYLRKRSMERAADELRAGNALGPLLEGVRAPAFYPLKLPRSGCADSATSAQVEAAAARRRRWNGAARPCRNRRWSR